MKSADRWAWVLTISEELATRARDVLSALVDAFDQTLRATEIPPFPRDAGPNPGIGTEDYWLAEQGKVIIMLRNRGVLTSAVSLGNQGFRIEGDEATVREAHRRLTDRLNPRATSALRAATVAPEESVPSVFIGHGRSPVWRELRDLLQDRLGLRCVEFNTVSVAGIPTAERLSELLGEATFAFLLMTAEDEHEDGTLHARENVIHEVGLFQGRLGFRKAIVILEEGCTEFSNIHGLGQIRFPSGQVSAASEAIRQVLEREGLVQARD